MNIWVEVKLMAVSPALIVAGGSGSDIVVLVKKYRILANTGGANIYT